MSAHLVTLMSVQEFELLLLLLLQHQLLVDGIHRG